MSDRQSLSRIEETQLNALAGVKQRQDSDRARLRQGPITIAGFTFRVNVGGSLEVVSPGGTVTVLAPP